MSAADRPDPVAGAAKAKGADLGTNEATAEIEEGATDL